MAEDVQVQGTKAGLIESTAQVAALYHTMHMINGFYMQLESSEW